MIKLYTPYLMGNPLSRVVAASIVVLLCSGEPVLATEGNLPRFMQRISNAGFIIQEGLVDFPDVIEMCCKCELPSCFGNNANNPYGVFVLPPAPDQAINAPNPYSEWFTEDGTYAPGWSWFWRLRPDEAVVFIGTTPPKMEYFGFTPYLYDRYQPNNPYQLNHDAIPNANCTTGDGVTRAAPLSAEGRIPLFASLGDTVNNLTINVGETAGTGDLATNPFLRNVVFILAADLIVEAQIRAALIGAGYPDDIINTLVVSPKVARLGVESDKDSLAFVMRMTVDADAVAMQDYKNSPSILLRISPATPVPASDIYPLPLLPLRVRGSGATEMELLTEVDRLGRSIVAAYPDYDAVNIATLNWDEGANCITKGENCQGDNRDTPYIIPSRDPVNLELDQDMVLHPGEFYVAYGVNHKASGKAVYSNVSIVGWNKKSSPEMIGNAEMLGSAAAYLGVPSNDPIAISLYAVKVTRPGGCAGEPLCKEIPDDCPHGIAADEPLALAFRAYVDPVTKVGPPYSEIITDRILKFTPKTTP